MSQLIHRLLILIDVLIGKFNKQYKTITFYTTSTGTMPGGAVSYNITNLGESALNATFHPYTVGDVTHVVSVKSISDTANGKGSFGALTYNADPTSSATPNTLLIEYTIEI